MAPSIDEKTQQNGEKSQQVEHIEPTVELKPDESSFVNLKLEPELGDNTGSAAYLSPEIRNEGQGDILQRSLGDSTASFEKISMFSDSNASTAFEAGSHLGDSNTSSSFVKLNGSDTEANGVASNEAVNISDEKKKSDSSDIEIETVSEEEIVQESSSGDEETEFSMTTSAIEIKPEDALPEVNKKPEAEVKSKTATPPEVPPKPSKMAAAAKADEIEKEAAVERPQGEATKAEEEEYDEEYEDDFEEDDDDEEEEEEKKEKEGETKEGKMAGKT